MRHSFANLQLGNTLPLSCSCSGCWPLPALYGWSSSHLSRRPVVFHPEYAWPISCIMKGLQEALREGYQGTLCTCRAAIPKAIVGVHAAFHVLYTILATFCREWSLQQNVSRVQVGAFLGSTTYLALLCTAASIALQLLHE